MSGNTGWLNNILKVAAVQMDQKLMKKEKNLEKIIRSNPVIQKYY
jgi:hypothetical protein